MCETHTHTTPLYRKKALRGSFCCTSEIEMSEAQQSSLIATQLTNPFSLLAFPFIYVTYSHKTHINAKPLQKWVLSLLLTVYIHSKCVVVCRYATIFAVGLIKQSCCWHPLSHWAAIFWTNYSWNSGAPLSGRSSLFYSEIEANWVFSDEG